MDRYRNTIRYRRIRFDVIIGVFSFTNRFWFGQGISALPSLDYAHLKYLQSAFHLDSRYMHHMVFPPVPDRPDS